MYLIVWKTIAKTEYYTERSAILHIPLVRKIKALNEWDTEQFKNGNYSNKEKNETSNQR